MYFPSSFLPEYKSLAAAKESDKPLISLRLPLPKNEDSLIEIFSLPNLCYLSFDAAKYDGGLQVPDNLEITKTLERFRLENFTFFPNMEQLPLALLQPLSQQVEQLDFIRCASLLWNNFNLVQFSQLRYLKIFACGDTAAWGMGNLPVLEGLMLETPFTTMPEHFGSLRQLKKLAISLDNSAMPGLSTIANFDLDEFELAVEKDIPNWIGKLNPNLKQLSIRRRQRDMNISSITDEIYNYKKLEKLELLQLLLFQISPKIGELSQLKELLLQENKLEELPNELASLQHLSYISLFHNPFKRLPSLLCRLPKPATGELRIGIHEELLTPFRVFEHWFRNADLMPDFQQFVCDIWDGKPTKITTPNYANIKSALFSGVLVIQHALLHYLVKESPQAYRNPQKGDTLGIITKTKTPKAKLKSKLKILGIGLVFLSENDAWNDKITHLLIDEKSNIHTDYWLGNEAIALMDESQLIDFIDHSQPDYLVEDAINSGDNSEMVERVNQLLFSLEDANIEIALGLLKSGGIPKACTTALFTAAKLASDAKIRSKALKMLQSVASVPLSLALKQRADFINISGYYDFGLKINLFENLGLDLLKFADCHFEKFSMDAALAYTREKRKSMALEYRLYEACQNGCLAINVAEFADKRIPTEIESLTELRELSVYRWRDCKNLDELFPKNLKKLEKLQRIELNFSGSSLHQIPPMFLLIFAQLSALRSIRIPDLSAAAKASLQAHLPHCSIE